MFLNKEQKEQDQLEAQKKRDRDLRYALLDLNQLPVDFIDTMGIVKRIADNAPDSDITIKDYNNNSEYVIAHDLKVEKKDHE